MSTATKKKVRYETGSVPADLRGKGDQQVVFWSTKKNLKTFIYKYKDDGETYESIPIQFSGETFTTGNKSIIEAMRSSRLYGGSRTKNFEDAQPGESFFYEEGYPDHLMKHRIKEQEEIVHAEGIYEA
jgi:hypothetical protein